MTLRILQSKTTISPKWKIEWFKVEMPIEPSKVKHIGIDPGTAHIGIAETIVNTSCVFTYEITMNRISDPIQRIYSVSDLLSDIIWSFTEPTFAVIEGSAHGFVYRQTELAEWRAAAVLWCKHKVIMPRLVPPQTIRKQVFGSAKIKAEETWPELPSDAASALACAICSMKMGNKNE